MMHKKDLTDVDTLVSEPSASRIVRNKYLLFVSYQASGILLQPHKMDEDWFENGVMLKQIKMQTRPENSLSRESQFNHLQTGVKLN